MTRDQAVLRRVLPLVVLATVLTVGGLYVRCQRAPVTLDGSAYAKAYAPPRNGLEAAINEHDGAAFATLAMDLSLSHPEQFDGGASEEAFRANRPLLAWLAWLTAAGRNGAVEWSLVGWSVVGVLGLLVATALLAATVGADSRQAAMLTLLMPGTVVLATYVGLADGVGAALSLLGLAFWLSRRWRLATVVLTFAVLARESGLLAVAALGLWETFGNRDWRRAIPLAIPCAGYAAWTSAVAWRLGYWPTSPEANNRGGAGFRTAAPGAGLWRDAHLWGATEWGAFAVIAGIVVAALLRRRGGPLTVFIWLSVIYASVLGWGVWDRTIDFARVLTPLTAVAIVVVLQGARLEAAGEDDGRGERSAHNASVVLSRHLAARIRG